MTDETALLSPAERFYKKHLERVVVYQKKHPEKMREKCKKWNAKIKAEEPEKYKALLESKRKYYLEVRKPKREAEKAKLKAEQEAHEVREPEL